MQPEQIILDPGLGFAKNAEQNWELLRATGQFAQLGHNVLVGRLPQALPRHPADHGGQGRRTRGTRRTPRRRLRPVRGHGAWGVRVHDAGASLDAVKVAAAWARVGRDMAARTTGRPDIITLTGITAVGYHGVFD